MNQVRDPAIVASRLILDGDGQAADDRRFLQLVDSLPPESKQLLEQLITQTIDLTIFNFLTLFEQQSDFVLAAQEEEEEVIDLNELSDGLGGELWGTRDGSSNSVRRTAILMTMPKARLHSSNGSSCDCT